MTQQPLASLAHARARHRAQVTRWGFVWALWCAVLWGAWYLPGAAIWYEHPFATIDADETQALLLAAGVIGAFNAVATVFFLGLWTGVLGKWRETLRTARQTRHIAKWFLLAGLAGGPMAHWGTFLAIVYVGPVFAAIAALMYPIFGAVLARLWYQEKITARVAMGIFLLVAGVTLRFLAEAVYWVVVILPLTALLFDWPVLQVLRETLNPWAVVWLGMLGLTYAFCYAAWYKSFPLIGVGRGCAFSTLCALFAVIYLSVFTLEPPALNFVLGLLLAIIGVFVMFTERSQVMEVVRSVEGLAEPRT